MNNSNTFFGMFIPPPHLRQFIKAYYINEIEYSEKIYHVPAWTKTMIMFHYGDLYYRNTQDQGPYAPASRASFHGNILKPYTYGGKDLNLKYVAVELNAPFIYDLTKTDVSQFTDLTVDMKDMFAKTSFSRLLDTLYSSRSRMKQVRALNIFFTDFFKTIRTTENCAALELYHNMMAAKGKIPLSDLYESVPFSNRHIRREFLRVFGLSPKKYLKLTRVENIISQLNYNPRLTWGDIVYKYNYTDQSHFINEFKSVMGITPGDAVTSESLDSVKHLFQ